MLDPLDTGRAGLECRRGRFLQEEVREAVKVPWALSVSGRAPRDTDEPLAYLREMVEALEDRFGLELEWANASGHDLLADGRRSER